MQNNLNKQAKQNGFTLLELMISLALGVILLAALATVYMNAARSGAQREVNETLDQTARTVFDIFGHDFALAGFVDEFDNGQNKINDYLTYDQSKKELTVKYQATDGNDQNGSLYTNNQLTADKFAQQSGDGYDCVGSIMKVGTKEITNIYKFDQAKHKLTCKGSNENTKFYALVDGIYDLKFRFLTGKKTITTSNTTQTTTNNTVRWEIPSYQKGIDEKNCSDVFVNSNGQNNKIDGVKNCMSDQIINSIGGQPQYVFLTPKGITGSSTTTTIRYVESNYQASNAFSSSVNGKKDVIAVEVCVVVASDAGKSYSANKYAEFQPKIPSCDRSNGNDFVAGSARSPGDNKLYRRYVSVFNVPNSNFYKTDLAATKGKK